MAQFSIETGQKRDKKDAFRRLAEQRTNAVLEKLRVLGNCSNRGLYEFDEADIRKIFRAISEEVAKTRSKFLDVDKKRFSLGRKPNE